MSVTAGTRIHLGFAPDETVVVTGAGSGIGRALALHALEVGLRVSAWDVRPDGLETLREEAGPDADLQTVVADISSTDDVTAGFAAVRERFGTPSYLANNAGPGSELPLAFEEALAICVGGVRSMTETWAGMGLPSHAAMVVTTSVAGNKIGIASDWYSASKAALMGYIRHLAAYRADEFRCNGVAPGMTDTPRLGWFAQSEKGQRVLERIPLHRMGAPDDIAWSILFLLSPLAAYINGEMLTVDGGWTITQ